MRFSTQGRTLLELALVRIACLDQLQHVATLLEQLRTGGGALPAPPHPKPHPKMPPLPAGQGEGEQPTADRVPLYSGSPQPDEWSDAVALQVWQAGIQSLPTMTICNAEQYDTVRAMPPDIMIVSMKSTFAKNFCERDTAKIQTLLEKQLGRPVQLRFELSAVAETHVQPPPQTVSPQQNKLKLMAEASQSPFVQKAEEIFKATLTDIK